MTAAQGGVATAAWATAVVAFSLLAPGCAFLVSDDPIRCEAVAEEADPCPRDRVCVSGFCVPAPVCVPSTELCNGLDDDCDMLVDEGHDDDGDGFSWCGAGLADEADCDDTRADVHPGSALRSIVAAVELCDSRDNDCDESVDEDDGTLCAALEHCFAGVGCAVPDCTYPGFECSAGDACDVDAVPPACVTGVCTPLSCTAPEVCDGTSGSCVRPLPLDSACVVSAQCEEGACVPSRALTGGNGSVCAKSCCEDEQCPAGRICWASPNNARACLLPSSIGSAWGNSPLGASCSASTQCASARCLDGLCRQTCGRNADCDVGDSCALLPSEDVDPVQALACLDITGGEIGAPCTASAPCASKMCVLRIETGGSICLGGCHTSADCPSDMFCGSASVRMPDATQTNLQVCEPRVHPGGALSGEPCATAWSCRDLACIGGLCADTCCSDTQCPVDFACEPVNRGSDDYEMRCIPR